MSPIFKGGSRSVTSNYRPVSLTSVCCKVLERIISSHIYDYLEEFSLISPHQFGFRAGHSTEDQLLIFYNKVSSWVHDGFSVDVAFLDFSKAFDVVDHGLLLTKLESLGFDGMLLRWISGFLIGREMSIGVNGLCSTVRPVTSGVPQGSVLGPVLFLIYVNFLMRNVECEWKAFADDFKVCTFYKVRMECNIDTSPLQRDLERINASGRSCNLKLNTQKCAVMRLGGDVGDATYTLQGESIQWVSVYRDLGVTVDNKLKFHVHIRAVVGRAGGLMSNLLRSTKCRTANFMLRLFISHIRPTIDYCSTVWNTGYLGDIRLLESLQRRWTREIEGLGNQEYSTRLKSVGLYSVYGRLLRLDLLKVWKSFNSERETALSDIFTPNEGQVTRGHRFKLVVPVARTDSRRKFFSVRVVNRWNSLPARVVNCVTACTFKKHLDEHLGDLLFSYL